MRLLYFDPTANSFKGLEDVISSEIIQPNEVVLLVSGDELNVLINAVSEAIEAVDETEFMNRLQVSSDQAKDWRRRLAQIVSATYVPE